MTKNNGDDLILKTSNKRKMIKHITFKSLKQ